MGVGTQSGRPLGRRLRVLDVEGDEPFGSGGTSAVGGPPADLAVRARHDAIGFESIRRERGDRGQRRSRRDHFKSLALQLHYADTVCR